MNYKMTDNCIKYIISHEDDITASINDYGELKKDLDNLIEELPVERLEQIRNKQ